MHGLGFFLGVGLSLLGLAYTFVVLCVPGSFFGLARHPYLLNGIALCILGFSALGRDLFLPRWAVYLLWASAAYLAIRAHREIRGARGGILPPRPRPTPWEGGNGKK